MVTINFTYGKKSVSLKSEKIFVTFETRSLTLYFGTKEEAKNASAELGKLSIKTINYGKYILALPQYNTNINIL
jgi:hypothetical protein